MKLKRNWPCCEHLFTAHNLPSGGGRLTCEKCGQVYFVGPTWMQRWYRERLAVANLLEVES